MMLNAILGGLLLVLGSLMAWASNKARIRAERQLAATSTPQTGNSSSPAQPGTKP